MEKESKYLVAVTGASGVVYGVRTTGELLKRGYDVELIVSPPGFLVLKEELGFSADPAGPAEDVEAALEALVREHTGGELAGRLAFVQSDDLLGEAASGSAMRRAMVVSPCSMGTLARVACGVSGNLIERAADCVLKERGTLVLVPRETPLNTIHLENMAKLSRMGAVVLPAMPAFYHHPESVTDMVDFVVGKTLDVLGIPNTLYSRWDGKEKKRKAET